MQYYMQYLNHKIGFSANIKKPERIQLITLRSENLLDMD